MTSKPPDPVPPSGTRFDFPPETWTPAQLCGICRQPRTPLFQARPETHAIAEPVKVCLRCWSSRHHDVHGHCPHCGKPLDQTPLSDGQEPLW